MKRLLTLTAVAVVAAVLRIGIPIGVRAAHTEAPEPHVVASAPAGPVALVSTGFAQQREMTETLIAFGEVSPGPLAAFSFARAGQVTGLAVLPGDRVTKGTALATLTLDPAARETYSQAMLTATLAARDRARLQQLLSLQLATQSQVDAGVKAEQDASSALRALDALGGASPSSTIVAPFDGWVASIAVVRGDRVPAGAPVLQLGRLDDLRVQIGIEPAQRRRLHVGTRVQLTPLADVADQPAATDAAVGSIQDMVDAKTQLVNVIVRLPRDSLPVLVPGMKVQAVVEVATRTATAVPRDAVLSDSRGDFLYQVIGGKAVRMAVGKRQESEGYVAITGLADKSLPVVTVGNYELQNGMSVRQAQQ